MKRIFSLLFVLVLVLTMAPAVRADIIYIPNDFFLDGHWDECTEVRRVFTARAEVNVYKSPKSDQIAGTLAEGQTIHVYYTWTDEDGNEWGYIERYDPEYSGWLPMAYMALQYDHISFREDYGHLFTKLESWTMLDGELVGQEVWFWDYPGSDRGNPWLMNSQPGFLPEYQTVYTDSDGLEWCYVDYYMGRRDFWICLSDPTADFAALYPEGSPEVEITEPLPSLPDAEIKPGTASPLPIILGSGVVLCVIVTAAVLLRRKKKE